MSKSFSHYNFQLDKESGDYKFITDEGITYACVFLEDEASELFGLEINAKIFQFSFFPTKSVENYKPDTFIHQTIIVIIQQFFSKNPSDVLIYYCSDYDSKGRARNSLFTIWHRRYNSPPKKKLFNLVFNDGFDISVLALEEHPEIEKIHNIFEEEVKYYQLEGKTVQGNIIV